MFAVRGMAVSFSVFAMAYCVLSLAVRLAWPRVWRFSQRYPMRHTADLLFALRLLPLVFAALLTAGITLPSFLLLEPRSIDEPMNGALLVLGAAGAMLGAYGMANAALALHRASRIIAKWTNGAQLVRQAPVPLLRIANAFPAMTAAGIVRSRVLVSSTAESVLNANELRSALSHELVHVQSRDNLKKLLLRFVSFPGMAELEAAWLEATEMAADDAAVTNRAEALDLAAALIKLSRISPSGPLAELTVALVHSPATMVNARVERLIRWKAAKQTSSAGFSAWYGLAAAAATVALFVASYHQLLLQVHSATEWLVR